MRSMTGRLLATVGLSALICTALLTTGCPPPPMAPDDQDQDQNQNQNESDDLSGTVEVADFMVAAGESRTIADDVTIRASGMVMIDGDLMVDEDRGQSITIEAEGDIVIAGQIVAGNADDDAPTAKSLRSQATADRNGGDVVIESKNGSIVFMDSARITAGDGADGVLEDDGMSGGTGGRGGDVFFTAPNGSLTLPTVADAIHLGNGGSGADVEMTDGTSEAPPAFENGGGRSGLPRFDTPVIEGATSSTMRLEEDLVDVLGETIGEAGEVVTVIDINFDPNPFSGGIGGDAGNVTIEMDEESESTAKRRNQSQTQDFLEFDVQGADGAPGWFTGGKGADARAVGSDGSGSSPDGRNVRAIGGTGGPCGTIGTLRATLTLLIVECTGGPGGNAFAQGGNGADGAPGENGGDGGKAIAQAGGSLFNLSTTGAVCADATAIGGMGGDGGSGCDISDTGGNGGDGGDADADGPFGFVSCTDRKSRLTATGGMGGDGGDDENNPGDRGTGGNTDTNESVTDTVESTTESAGDDGASGEGCPANPDPDEPDEFTKLKTQDVTPESGVANTSLAESCNVFGDGQGADPLVNSCDFTIPENATRIRVTVTASDTGSRVNVFARANTAQDGFSACGSDQSSNMTVLEFTPNQTGAAFVAIADRAVVSETYTICIEVQQ